jgi:hypothetical protein
MLRNFRKYHHQIGIILCLPLFLTVLSGMGITISREILHQYDLSETLTRLHTLELFHLEKIYPLLNGLGLIGLLVTGVTMTRLFRKSRHQNSEAEK